MAISIVQSGSPNFPAGLRNLSDPPAKLYCRGAPLQDLLARPCLAIVGSRRVSPYGRQVTLQLAGALAAQGVVIISGLALGVDALAHQAALEAGGATIAVLPSALDKLYPPANARLGERIVEQGGVLVSEYAATLPYAFKYAFIARNRLIAGLSRAVLITEAAEKSGSLHTANFALEQGKEVLAVPGPITSPTSAGANNLIKAGALPVTSYTDVLEALGLEDHRTSIREVRGQNEQEQRLLDLLLEGVNDGDELLARSQLSISEFNQVLTMLELGGKVRSLGLNRWALR